ncbi:MAG: hypothetical protein ACO1TE_27145 [Prosthecobacter sp.]
MSRILCFTVLLWIATCGRGMATTYAAPGEKIFSDAEAAALQQELAKLPPEKFLQKLREVPPPDEPVQPFQPPPLPGGLRHVAVQPGLDVLLPPVPGYPNGQPPLPEQPSQRVPARDHSREPPLWLGIYTSSVVAEAFRLLSPERAAELLPVLWELRDTVLPEQTVLFAAECFAALPEREKHPAFAARLDSELKALMSSPVPRGNRDSFNGTQFRRRAVDALVALWQGTQAEQQAIIDLCMNASLDGEIRRQVIRHLTDILIPFETHLAGVGHGDFSHIQKQRLYKWRPQWDKLRARWADRDWVKDLLLPLAESPTQPAGVRSAALSALCRLPGQGQNADLGKRLLPLAESPTQPADVRASVLNGLSRLPGQGQNAELRKLQITFLQSAENRSELRRMALYGLTKDGLADDDLKQVLTHIAGSPEESSRIRNQVMSALGRLWKDDPEIREMLARVMENADDHVPVQKEAMRALVMMGSEDKTWQQERLVKVAAQPGLPWPLRRAAVEMLGGITRRQDASTVVKDMLMRVAMNTQEPQKLRIHTFHMLAGHAGRGEEAKAALLQTVRSAGEADAIRMAALGALNLRPQPGKDNDWMKELLLPLAGPQEKSVAVRMDVLWDLPQAWDGAPWMEELYASLLSSPTELEEVRAHMVRAAYHGGWAADAWLKDLLVSFMAKTERHAEVRVAAVETVANIWRDEPWPLDLVRKIATSTDEPPVVRNAALRALAQRWPEAEGVGQIFLSLIASPQTEVRLRIQAMHAAQGIRSPDARMAELMSKIARSTQEPRAVRLTALRARPYRWRWQEHADLLAALSGPEEKDPEVRELAAFERAVVREGWVSRSREY